MTTEGDLPGTGTATDTIDTGMTFAEGVSGIADLIEDPETDLPESNEAPGAEDDIDFTEGDPGEEDGDFSEDVGTEGGQEGEGSEADYAGGRFAADNAKVKLEDGSTITIAELKRNNLFQRDYTKKTTELAAEREQVAQTRSQVDQYVQQLNQFREFGEWLVQSVGIQDPGPYTGAPDDPVAYLQHRQRKDQYDAIANGFAQFQAAQQSHTSVSSQEAERQAQERIRGEIQQLQTKLPALRDPAKNKMFWDRLQKGAAEYYGIPADLVQTIGDHRMALVLHDAIEGRRLRQAAPKVKEQVQGKPRIVTGSRRGNPQAAQARESQIRAERLRKTGDFAAGVQSLMDLDL